MPVATGANDDGDVGVSNSEGDVLMRSLRPLSVHINSNRFCLSIHFDFSSLLAAARKSGPPLSQSS